MSFLGLALISTLISFLVLLCLFGFCQNQQLSANMEAQSKLLIGRKIYNLDGQDLYNLSVFTDWTWMAHVANVIRQGKDFLKVKILNGARHISVKRQIMSISMTRVILTSRTGFLSLVV